MTGKWDGWDEIWRFEGGEETQGVGIGVSAVCARRQNNNISHRLYICYMQSPTWKQTSSTVRQNNLHCTLHSHLRLLQSHLHPHCTWPVVRWQRSCASSWGRQCPFLWPPVTCRRSLPGQESVYESILNLPWIRYPSSGRLPEIRSCLVQPSSLAEPVECVCLYR